MKKIFTLFSVLALTLILTSCGSNKSGLIISKYFDAYDLNDNAIELFNSSKKEVNLADYKLEIYPNGETIAEYKIDLEGTVQPNEYFLVTHSATKNELLTSKSDLKTGDLNYNGNDVIALTKKDKLYDTIGEIGNSVDFAKDITLIRKDEYLYPMKDYNAYAYIGYKVNSFEYLKNSDYLIKTKKQMIEGPKFDPSSLELPFVDPDNPSFSGGGAIKVTVERKKDGDTTDFKDSKGKTYTMRYMYIDTKEVAGTGSPNGQEWGYPASNFTNYILTQASEIYIQTIKGESLLDGFGRYLGLVWVDGELLNFMIVRAGLSEHNFSKASEDENNMTYKNIPYYSFLADAAARAKANKWGMNGETDPMWDYDNNKKSTTNGNFIPKSREYDQKIDK